jgi:hypothetical protein
MRGSLMIACRTRSSSPDSSLGMHLSVRDIQLLDYVAYLVFIANFWMRESASTFNCVNFPNVVAFRQKVSHL